jgi:hypothetical protein
MCFVREDARARRLLILCGVFLVFSFLELAKGWGRGQKDSLFEVSGFKE